MSKSILNTNDPWQLDGARKLIDPVIRLVVDELDDCYYGTPNATGRDQDGWKHGVSHPFLIWDFVPGEDNKLKFDLLSGLIHHYHFLAQHAFNLDAAAGGYEQVPEPNYNWVRNSSNQFVETKVQQSKRWIREFVPKWNSSGLTPVMNRPRLNDLANTILQKPEVQSLLSRRNDLAGVFDPEDLTDKA